MKSKFIIEIETTMNKKTMKKIKDEDGKLLPLSMFEKSIHKAIPKIIDNEEILEQINDRINEGGWIEDVEDYEFPVDYCELSIKVKEKK